MKQLSVFVLVFTLLCSFKTIDFVTKDKKENSFCTADNNFFCGWGLTLSNSSTPGSGGYLSFIMYQVKLYDQLESSYFNIAPNLGTGEADLYYGPYGIGYYNVAVDIYTEGDEQPNYVGIRDTNGNIVSCQQISHGYHTYNFVDVYLACGGCTIFTTDTPC